MTHMPLSRRGAGIAVTLACLLASPVAAQQEPAPAEAPTATEAAEATGPTTETGTAPVAETAPAPDAAPAITAAPAPALARTEERDPNLPHDLSPMGMYRAADWVVKSVMVGLIFASVVTWTVLVAKMLELWQASMRVQAGTKRVAQSTNLTEALQSSGTRSDAVSRMIQAASQEYDRSLVAVDQAGDDGLKERVDSHLDRIEALAGRRMSRGTGVLATIGSTAPFVGLFGTVWGIMNAFIGISESQTTNLAVVAPGIAEALLATALGLVAAIPAVVIYNVFARAITGYRLRLSNAAAGIRRMVSRDLDFRGVAAAPAETRRA
ncbi:tonB-system energizer ExbB [Paracoccus fistulariae]|uniref:Biopolymer transport protein ExbB n=1 Tax=Paracoccus fistulariae TaxID=658446 RepID=A0ABY7SHP8_9RHOB|nr:tonB-system energizer ExbB [Paracoccus fistulariae]MDB6181243.1 tonB-system energizer ExbB [Paracoccus fistulariae]WCR06523.1 tonB-system energizer ExbB [Paracoccus fistulariae]